MQLFIKWVLVAFLADVKIMEPSTELGFWFCFFIFYFDSVQDVHEELVVLVNYVAFCLGHVAN